MGLVKWNPTFKNCIFQVVPIENRISQLSENFSFLLFFGWKVNEFSCKMPKCLCNTIHVDDKVPSFSNFYIKYKAYLYLIVVDS